MRRSVLCLQIAAVVLSAPLAGQAVPQESQAARVEQGYRRTPQFRVDPFRHMFIPHWGFVFSVGATAENNSINFRDLGALMFLNDRDSLLILDYFDALGLVPVGAGWGGSGEAEGGFYLGGPIGSRMHIGVSLQGRGYGGFTVDDDAVALLRDGNGARQDFTLGETQGEGIGTGEVGLHALYRFGPFGSQDGARLVLGAGGRYIRPLAYANAHSMVSNGGILRVTGDSISASIDIETFHTPDFVTNRGSGIAGDFIVRVEWPTSGLTFEAMVGNVGRVTVRGVERRTLTVDLETTDVDEINDVLDTLDLALQGVEDLTVSLPRIVRFSGSAWANAILQLDASATLPYGGRFEIPLTVDLGTTWRFIRTFPLRAGIVMGGHQGLGFSGGFAIEARNFLFQAGARSLGGLFGDANGVGGRLELGAFF